MIKILRVSVVPTSMPKISFFSAAAADIFTQGWVGSFGKEGEGGGVKQWVTV